MVGEKVWIAIDFLMAIFEEDGGSSASGGAYNIILYSFLAHLQACTILAKSLSSE